MDNLYQINFYKNLLHLARKQIFNYRSRYIPKSLIVKQSPHGFQSTKLNKSLRQRVKFKEKQTTTQLGQVNYIVVNSFVKSKCKTTTSCPEILELSKNIKVLKVNLKQVNILQSKLNSTTLPPSPPPSPIRTPPPSRSAAASAPPRPPRPSSPDRHPPSSSNLFFRTNNDSGKKKSCSRSSLRSLFCVSAHTDNISISAPPHPPRTSSPGSYPPPTSSDRYPPPSPSPIRTAPVVTVASPQFLSP